MVSMMSVWENTVTRMFGRFSLNYLIIFLWLLSLKTKFSVFTVVFLPVLTHLIKFANSTEFKKYPTKDRFAIYCGLILMIVVAGEFLPEELDTASVKIFQNNSITPMAWPELPELIN